MHRCDRWPVGFGELLSRTPSWAVLIRRCAELHLCGCVFDTRQELDNAATLPLLGTACQRLMNDDGTVSVSSMPLFLRFLTRTLAIV